MSMFRHICQGPHTTLSYRKDAARLFDLDPVGRFKLIPRCVLVPRSACFPAKDDFWVPVCAWVNAHADRPPDGLGHLPLVDRPQTGPFIVHDSALWGHILGDHGEVLDSTLARCLLCIVANQSILFLVKTAGLELSQELQSIKPFNLSALPST